MDCFGIQNCHGEMHLINKTTTGDTNMIDSVLEGVHTQRAIEIDRNREIPQSER